ncbi:hypothetical protein [Acinetobacter baumannii]|uniref:hypothetical protein n=1 Tax=Acinetobacter baumannii TaxID=470 RepID=UPI0005AAC2F2|nr:hypothetical protein [Acinetobacter baumannii]
MNKVINIDEAIQLISKHFSINYSLLDIANMILKSQLQVFFRVVDGYITVNIDDLNSESTISDLAINLIHVVQVQDTIFIKPDKSYLPKIYQLLTNVAPLLNIPVGSNLYHPKLNHTLLSGPDIDALENYIIPMGNHSYKFKEKSIPTLFSKPVSDKPLPTTISDLEKLGYRTQYLISKESLCITQESITRLLKNNSCTRKRNDPFKNLKSPSLASEFKTRTLKKNHKKTSKEIVAFNIIKVLIQNCFHEDKDQIFTRSWVLEKIIDFLSDSPYQKHFPNDIDKLIEWLGELDLPEYATKRGRRRKNLENIAKLEIMAILKSIDLNQI